MGIACGWWGGWGARRQAPSARYLCALTIIFLTCLVRTVDAIPTLKNPVPILRQDGTTVSPWGDDGQNTPTNEGGTNYFFAPNGNDSNSCLAPETACRTVAKCRSVRSSGSNCLFERGGVWNESLQWNQSPSGTATNYTTYGAYGDTSKPLPVIDNSGASERIRGQRAYLWFDRIYWRDNGRTWVEDGSHHVVVSNSKVDSRYTCFGVSALPNNIRAHHVTYANNDMGPCGFSVKPCLGTTNGFEGFYIGNSDPRGYGALDVDIYNTRVRDTTKDPFNVKERVDNVTFRFSLIEDVQQCDDNGVVNGVDFRDKSNIHIYGNLLRNISKPGKSGALFAIGEGMRVENNVACGIRDFDLIWFGTDAQGTSDLLNNSFYDFEGILNSQHTASQNSHIKNNIGPGSISQNINSSAGLFATTSGCRLLLASGSAAINAAASCNGVTRDITWSARPVGGACDIGAHEFSGTGPPPPPPPPPPPDDPDPPPPDPAFNFFVETTGSDSNNGQSIATAFRTIQKCVDSGLVNLGSSCQVGGGTYSENITIASKFGTSHTAGFTIKARSGQTVIIKPNCGSNIITLTDNSAYVTITAEGTGHIVVDGANITGACAFITGYQGPTLSSADNSRLMHLEFKNCPSHSIYSDAGSRSMEFVGNNIYDSVAGITTTSQSNIIAANTIANNAASGVWVTPIGGSGPGFTQILNNRITGNGQSGIRIDSGTGISVWNNILAGNTQNGIYLEDAEVIGAGVHFNLAYGNGHGFIDGGADGAFIFSNIFWGNLTANFTLVSTNSTLASNFTTNPIWTSPTTGDFTLRSDSPVIDNATCIPELGFDILNNVRPDAITGRCDAGPYEGAGSGPPPPSTNARFILQGGILEGGQLN